MKVTKTYRVCKTLENYKGEREIGIELSKLRYKNTEKMPPNAAIRSVMAFVKSSSGEMVTCPTHIQVIDGTFKQAVVLGLPARAIQLLELRETTVTVCLTGEYERPEDPYFPNKDPQKTAEDVTKENGKEDLINSPSHYTGHPSGVECIDITKHHDFCTGNAIKSECETIINDDPQYQCTTCEGRGVLELSEDLPKIKSDLSEKVKEHETLPSEDCIVRTERDEMMIARFYHGLNLWGTSVGYKDPEIIKEWWEMPEDGTGNLI